MEKSGLNILIISLVVIIVGFIVYYLLFLNKPPIESIIIDNKSINIFPGDTYELSVTISPDDANKEIYWESENKDVASISDEGIVTGISVGKAIITAKNEDGDITDNCVVNVIKKEVKEIILKKEEIEIIVGESSKIEIEVLPKELKQYKLTWESSNSEIVTVDENGNIIGLKNGEADITVSSGEVVSTCKVKVITMVESVTISKSRTTIDVETSDELIVIVNPENASNKNVTWESSDPSIATVDENGKVTGIKPGEVIVTATTVDGGKKVSCDVTVILIPRYTIKFIDNNQSIIKKEGETLGTLPTPKKEGYIFKGWFTDSKEGTQVTEKTIVKNNMNIYAHWEEEETFTEGPGQGIYSRTVTYMGRTFKDYKQNRMGAAIEAGGCGPVSLLSIASGYNDSITIDQIIKVSGLSTSFNYINAAARSIGLSHSQIYVYSSRNPVEPVLQNLTNIAKSELRAGHQLIVLVTRSSMCDYGICNGYPYDAYSWGNHFIAIIGLKKDGEHVIIFNPQEVRMEEGTIENILRYYLPGGPQSGFVSYWR